MGEVKKFLYSEENKAVFGYLLEEKSKDFEFVSNLVMKYLAENHHPHKRIIADSTSCELLDGIKSNHRGGIEE